MAFEAIVAITTDEHVVPLASRDPVVAAGPVHAQSTIDNANPMADQLDIIAVATGIGDAKRLTGQAVKRRRDKRASGQRDRLEQSRFVEQIVWPGDRCDFCPMEQPHGDNQKQIRRKIGWRLAWETSQKSEKTWGAVAHSQHFQHSMRQDLSCAPGISINLSNSPNRRIEFRPRPPCRFCAQWRYHYSGIRLL